LGSTSREPSGAPLLRKKRFTGPSGCGSMFQKLSTRLWLVTFRSIQAESPEKILKIRIDEAFNPTHPTTRLCLDLLPEALVAIRATNLLDVGCGAGILGLAAAALGIPMVVGVDLAGQATRETLANARENQLPGPLQVVQGSTECLKATFDLVVANLPWEVQMAKAPELDRLAAPLSSLILSGFRRSQEGPLLAAYHRLGWRLTQRVIKDFRHPELPTEIDFTWVAWVLNRTCS
jgi:ribosomal protein L11 methylase PrmA